MKASSGKPRSFARCAIAAFGVIALAALAAAPAHAAAGIELFDAERLSGYRLPLEGASRDLNDNRFRDRAVSAIVYSGRWELCPEPDFRGACIVFSPGRYESFPAVIAQRVASARPVQVIPVGATNLPQPLPPAPPPGWGGPTGAAPPFEGAPIVLHEHAGGGGRAVDVTAAVDNLLRLGFNDRASSIEVRRGRWELCSDAGWSGECRVFGRGRHALEGGLHDGVSSLRPVFGNNDRPLPTLGGVLLHEDSGFAGREVLVTQVITDLRSLDFNDRASSIEVLGGRWELCSDGGHGGTCQLFGPGRHELPRGLFDRVSSLRPR
jgi:hypothetical protein